MASTTTESLDKRRDESEAARIDARLTRIEALAAELTVLIRRLNPPAPQPRHLRVVKAGDDG